MAEWIVEGTDRDGRTPRREIVEAPNSAMAKAEAYKRGVVPTSVARARESDPVFVGEEPLRRQRVWKFFKRDVTANTRCWIVKGAMRESGTPTEMRFDAEAPGEAERRALRAGMLVREVAQAPPGWTEQGAMLIEKTSKKLKSGMVISGLIVLTGVYALFTADGQMAIDSSAGATALFGGAFLFAVFKIAAWWQHG